MFGFGCTGWTVSPPFLSVLPLPGLETIYLRAGARVKWDNGLKSAIGDAVTDREGNKWDGQNKGAFLFRYADEGQGIKLKSTQIFADSSPAMKMMLEKGLLDAESLKGIVIGS